MKAKSRRMHTPVRMVVTRGVAYIRIRASSAGRTLMAKKKKKTKSKAKSKKMSKAKKKKA